jgi:hypothetical protein
VVLAAVVLLLLTEAIYKMFGSSDTLTLSSLKR